MVIIRLFARIKRNKIFIVYVGLRYQTICIERYGKMLCKVTEHINSLGNKIVKLHVVEFLKME